MRCHTFNVIFMCRALCNFCVGCRLLISLDKPNEYIICSYVNTEREILLGQNWRNKIEIPYICIHTYIHTYIHTSKSEFGLEHSRFNMDSRRSFPNVFSKILPEGPPRRPQGFPRRLQGLPRRLQGLPRRSQGLPRHPQGFPRCPRELPKAFPKSPPRRSE